MLLCLLKAIMTIINDDTIILASAITLNELHEKKKIINA